MVLENKYTWYEICDRVIDKAKIKENLHEFKKWFISKEYLGYLFDPLLYHRAFLIQRSLYNDYDHFTVVCGMEGCGKSTFALQLCGVVSPTFGIQHICYEPEKLFKVLEVAKRGDSLLLDEGALFLFSRDAMSMNNKQITKLFTIFRQMNLHICICIPNFWMLESYIRDHRVKTLVHVIHRSHYVAYTGDSIKIISHVGRDKKSFNGIRVQNGTFWDGYFRKEFPKFGHLTEEMYREEKLAIAKKFVAELISDGVTLAVQKPELITTSDAARILGMKTETMNRRIKRGDIKGQQIGKLYYINREELSRISGGKLIKTAKENGGVNIGKHEL